MREFLPEIINIVGSIIGILVIILLKMAKDWLMSKISNDKLKAAIESADDKLVMLVKANQQILVDKLKQDAADGKITKDELVGRLSEIKQNTIDSVINMIGPAAKELLDKNVGDVKNFLSTRLEAMLDEYKKK